MFPSFVWKAKLRPEVHEPINDSIRRALGEIGAPLADLKSGESWQSDQGLHELNQFRQLVDCINEAAESVLGYLKIGHAGFKITGCWANLNAPGAGHPAYSHPNNYLSGVCYVRTHPDANTINFLDSRPRTGIILPLVTALTAENTDQVVVKVQDGTLLMFPAWLRASIELIGSDGRELPILPRYPTMLAELDRRTSAVLVPGIAPERAAPSRTRVGAAVWAE